MIPRNEQNHLTIQALIFSTNRLAKNLLGQSSARPKRSKRIDLPWEAWELDGHFFTALSHWTIKHPESSLDRVLDQISKGLEDHKSLLELIPDSPFPARGLVIALAHLFKLGVKTSHAKKDIQAFSKEVIHWVEKVKSEFESSEDGEFTRRAWQNLTVLRKPLRDLIDEICLWAANRLEDGIWWRHGHTIQREIQEFRERIEGARRLFMDLSAINQGKGFDRNQQALRRLEDLAIENQGRQIQKLDQVSDKVDAHREVDDRERFFAKSLDPHIVFNPTYDNHGKRPCDQGTRVEILDKIRTWVNDTGLGSPNFLWLTGVPGSGKSAISASFARECKNLGILWAQYFITRTDTVTTNPKRYFPSIARQLADRSPEVANAIRHALKETPSLTDDISTDQAAALFTDSICKASELDPLRPVVIIIDGLDETDHGRLDETAELLSALFSRFKHLSNVKIFISSRTEDEIHRSFSPPSDNYVHHIDLNTGDPTSIRDVSDYVRRNLQDIFRKHKLNWDDWSGDEYSRALGKKASGLFIWGVTAVKFIQERIGANGREGFGNIFKTLTSGIPPGINALYTQILETTLGEDPWELERFRRFVGAILFWKKPLRIGDLTLLLDLRGDSPYEDSVDIIHIMGLFRTILVAGTSEVDAATIPRPHKSVIEFLTSPNVDARYRVEPRQAHLEIGIQCLVHLGAVHKLTSWDALPRSFLYACDSWSFHLSQADILGSQLICADYRHSPSLDLPSLFLKPTSPMGQLIQISIGERGRFEISLGSYKRVSYIRASMGQRRRAAPTSFLFSSDAKQVVTCSKVDKRITACDVSYCPWARTLVQGSSPFTCLALSPDGKTIASGLHDGSIRFWDSSSSAPIGIPMIPSNSNRTEVQCIDFSPDGEQIVAGSGKLCMLWDTSTGQHIGSPWHGHEHEVSSIAFSSSGQRICSADVEGYYYIWDARTKTQMGGGRRRRSVNCISFSPQSDSVVALGNQRGIGILFGNSMWSDNKVGWIPCLQFAPDGKTIIFGTRKTIFVAAVDEEKATARIIRKSDYNESNNPFSIAFSRNLDYFAYSDWESFHVYSLYHNETSLLIHPVERSTPPTQLDDDADQTLTYTIPSLKEMRHKPKTVIKNRRLDNIKWYESDDATQTFGKVLITTDDAIIAADKDDSVKVWSWHKETR